jgi:hypothetical protein
MPTKNMKTEINRTIILPVVLYGCETWSLTLKEEPSLGVSEKSVKRKVYGPKRGEVKAECRRAHNGEVYDLYISLNITRVIKSVSRNSLKILELSLVPPEGRCPNRMK